MTTWQILVKRGRAIVMKDGVDISDELVDLRIILAGGEYPLVIATYLSDLLTADLEEDPLGVLEPNEGAS